MRIICCLLVFCSTGWAASSALTFAAGGATTHGNWSGAVTVSPAAWHPGDTVTVDATFNQANAQIQALAAAGIKADSVIMLVTAERTFDYGGHLRLPYDQYMSTLITPTGLPIEGGYRGAITTRFGQPYSTPFDQFLKIPIAATALGPGNGNVMFHVSGQLPTTLPPGIYRIRLDFGVAVGNSNYDLDGNTFAYQSDVVGQTPTCFAYSPLIPADGTTVSGVQVQASTIQPRVPWILLYNYNSNGYQGVIAEEDKPYFALSPRNMIQDDVVLPRLGTNGQPISYDIEPQLIANSKDPIDIAWDYSSGQISVSVTGPDGKTTSLGQYPFIRQSGNGPTTGKTALTAWVPPAYGQYTVSVTGYMQDIYGNQYQGGGTYHFWIANRLTLATATFQGMPYPIGSTYGKDIAFAPPVPANVTVTATLYPNSDPTQAVTMNASGVATAGGVFGALQGNKSLTLSVPGEYAAHILATYTDRNGTMWVATMRHAGVVYDPNGPIVARGKKLLVNNNYIAQGNTNDEGYIDPITYNEHLIHLNFPYNPGDVLMIASEGQGANKVIPTMTYETTTNFTRDDAGLNGIGITNLKLGTTNGYSPHMFPEFINDWEYYYGSAARPGFVSRFVVGENYVRGPYWSVSPNAFGGQINASNNGDLPGDIYRLMGAVVVRKPGAQAGYGGYIASGFMLPRGTNNNRVIAAGSEDLTASTGQKGRVFLVGPRPGMTYPVGTSFATALQIDPILPVNVTLKMTYPDGRVQQTSGVSNPTLGSFSGPNTWVLDIPGLYMYTIQATWNGYNAVMPGLPATGGEIYVLEAQPPTGATGMQITTADNTTFSPLTGTHITGTSTGSSVHFTAVMPGAVLDSGDLPVTNGTFDYFFNPTFLNSKSQTYDIANRVTGAPEIGDVVHLSFFSTETTATGQTYHSFKRVVVRGTTVRVAQ